MLVPAYELGGWGAQEAFILVSCGESRGKDKMCVLLLCVSSVLLDSSVCHGLNCVPSKSYVLTS